MVRSTREGRASTVKGKRVGGNDILYISLHPLQVERSLRLEDSVALGDIATGDLKPEAVLPHDLASRVDRNSVRGFP